MTKKKRSAKKASRTKHSESSASSIAQQESSQETLSSPQPHVREEPKTPFEAAGSSPAAALLTNFDSAPPPPAATTENMDPATSSQAAFEQKESSESSTGTQESITFDKPPPSSKARGDRGNFFHDEKFDDALSSTSSRGSDISSSLEDFLKLNPLEMYQEIVDHCPFEILVETAERLALLGLRSEELEFSKIIWSHGVDNGISSQAMSAQLYFPPTRKSSDGQSAELFSAENIAELRRCEASQFTYEDVQTIFQDSNGNPLLGANTRWSSSLTRALEELFEPFCTKARVRLCESFTARRTRHSSIKDVRLSKASQLAE